MNSPKKELEMTTIVVFRKFPEGDIIALFPHESETDRHNTPGLCSSYQFLGQHSCADYEGCMRITSPATPEEYARLKQELERIGYQLDVGECG